MLVVFKPMLSCVVSGFGAVCGSTLIKVVRLLSDLYNIHVTVILIVYSDFMLNHCGV